MIDIRTFGVCLLVAAAAAAQNPAAPTSASPLTALEQNAKQKTAEWERLAQGLDAAIHPLLPCDPKAAAAITEVSKASEARVAALAAYLQEAGRQAASQTAAARHILASLQPLAGELATEKSEVTQEQLGVNGQIAGLAEAASNSGPRRPSFTGAQDGLRQIAALQQQRSGAVDSGIGHGDPAAAAMRDLVAQLESREASLKDARVAFEAEGVRWSAYYAARLARAQTECNVTKGVVAPPPAQPQGKQK